MQARARRLSCVPLLFVGGCCLAWDTLPHQRITRAALDSLEKRHINRFGPEVKSLIEIYCILPDRHLEMEVYGRLRSCRERTREHDIDAHPQFAA